MKKRENAETPCNPDYEQFNDTQWIKDAVQLIKCVPPFWKRFYDVENSTFASCNSKEDFVKIDLLTTRKGQNNVTTLNIDTCDELSFTKSITREPHNYCPPVREVSYCNTFSGNEKDKSWSLVFNVKFPDSFYTEITNSMEFGPESLGAGIGGYIGIFVGYSLMQIPSMSLAKVELL